MKDHMEIELRMRLLLIRTGALSVLLVATAIPARADATVFLGAMTAGSPRPALGVAVGRCPSIFGFEIEYATTLGAATSTHSSAGGVSANLMAQSARPTHGFQLYATGGFGLYGETFGRGVGSGEILAANIGGRAKIGLAGSLNLRLDYRVFVLGDAPDAASGVVVHQRPQRFSVGLSLAF